MANIKMCWPLERYYKSVKRSIQVILASDRIKNKELPPWFDDGCYVTYRKLTQIIPEILFVYQNLGLSEDNIGQSVTDLREGLTSDQKNQLARYIAKVLSIRQREFIPCVFQKDDFGDISLDRCKQILGSTNIYEIRGDLDAYLILGQIAQEDNQLQLEMADPEKGYDGIKELGDHLMQLFQNELRHKRISAFNFEEIAEGELPVEMAPSYKLILVNSYFAANDMGFRFPKLLKQFKAEGDVAYENRVKNYLLCMSEEQFSLAANLVDPDDPKQQQFIELYNDAQNQRSEAMLKGKKEKKDC